MEPINPLAPIDYATPRPPPRRTRWPVVLIILFLMLLPSCLFLSPFLYLILRAL